MIVDWTCGEDRIEDPEEQFDLTEGGQFWIGVQVKTRDIFCYVSNSSVSFRSVL